MTTAITGIVKTPVGWSFTFTEGPVDVYLRGEAILRDVADSPFVIADGQELGCPDVQIVAAGSEPPLGCAYVALQWRSVAGAQCYVVYEVVATVARAWAVIPANASDGYLTWKTAILEDGGAKEYYVTAKVGTAESVVHSVSTTVIRNPHVPPLAATVATVEGVTTITIDIDPLAGFG